MQHKKGSKVLIVEDNPDHLQAIELLIEDRYHVLCAINGTETIEIALKTPDLDAILMDIRMPEMDGYETCKTLKADPRTQHIPIVMMTGSPQDDTLTRVFAAGAADYVQKPLNVTELQARLRVHCQNTRLLRELHASNTDLNEALDRLDQRHAEDWQRIADQLRLSQLQLHSVIANLPVILFVIDDKGMFTLSEGLGLELIGLEAGQVVGQSAFEMYADYPDIVISLKAALNGQALRTRHQLMDNILEVHYAPLSLPDDKTGVIGIAVNITEQVQSELQQTVLFDISRATSSAPNTATILKVVRERLSVLVNTENFFVALYDERKDLYTFPLWADEHDTPLMEHRPLSGSLTDYVRRTGRAVMIRQADRERLRQAGEITQVGTASVLWLGVPLKTGQQVIGVMAIQSYDDPDAYTEHDLNILSYVAENVAWVIESKRKEDALKLSEERFSKAFFASPISVTLSKEDGLLIDANFGFERMFGYNRDEVLNVPNFAWRLYADLDARQTMLDHVKKHGYVHDYAVEMMHKQGIHLHCIMSIEKITVDGDVVMLANIRDVTRQYQLVKRLQTLNDIGKSITRAESAAAIAQAAVQHMMALFNYPYISVVAIDSETHIMDVLAWSLPQEPPSGLRPEHAKQISIEKLKQREIYHQPHLIESDNLTPAEQRLVSIGVKSYVVFPLLVDQHFIGAFVIGRHESGALSADMLQIGEEVATQLSVALYQASLHEQVRHHAESLEEQVKERTHQLTVKAKELEAFTYSVSHDLRAPLRAMSGFADILIEDFSEKLPQEAQFYLSRINYNAQHMSQLIDDLLSLSRVGRHLIVKRRIQPVEMIEQILDTLRLNGQIGDATFKIDPLPDCQADPALLRQVWVNLITNAIKYSVCESEAVIHIGADTDDAGHVVYYIRDNGVGFDVDYSDKLFQPFQRLHTDDNYEGTGIGLATVARIIRRHEGEIWAEGEVNRGATFYFHL